MPAHGYVDKNNLAAILATNWSAGLALELNLREQVARMSLPSVNKVVHSGFETQRRHHQKCKTGYKWPHKKDLCPPKVFFKKVLPTLL